MPPLLRRQLKHCILNASKSVHLMEVLLVTGKMIPCLCCLTSQALDSSVQAIVARKDRLPLAQVCHEGGDTFLVLIKTTEVDNTGGNLIDHLPGV